jgi:hypothetical protein
MNFIKFLLPFVALANASTNFTTTIPITLYESSQTMRLLEYKPIIEDYVVPIDKSALYVVTPPPSSNLSLIRHAFGSDADVMIAIAKCESNLSQSAISPTRDFGVFQINEKVWDDTANRLGLDYKNSFEDNLEMAVLIHRVQGKSAWVCYTKLYDKATDTRVPTT